VQQGFICFHNQAVSDYMDISPILPVPLENGFVRTGSIKIHEAALGIMSKTQFDSLA